MPDLVLPSIIRLIPQGARVLEIGCGRGERAAALGSLGYPVDAIDADPAAVDDARRRGVAAKLAAWPCPVAGRFDAVLFSRSLHHMPDVAAAVRPALAALADGGVLVADEFDYRAVDAGTAAWFGAAVRDLLADAGSAPATPSFLAAIRTADDPLAVWNADHAEHVHAFDDILRALPPGNRPTVREMPYLYRYLEAGLPEDQRSVAIVRRFAALEADAIRGGRIRAVGRLARVTARKADRSSREN